MIRYFKSRNGFCPIDEWEPYCWMSVETPDKEDYSALMKDFKVPMDFIEYIADEDETPRIEHEGEWSLVILRIPVRKSADKTLFRTVPLSILLNGEIVITVCTAESEMIPDFIRHTRSKGIHIRNAVNFIQRLNFSATFWYLKYLVEIHNILERAGEVIGRSISNDYLVQLMNLQKSLVMFNTALHGNESVVPRLHSLFPADVDTDLAEDIEVELGQARNTVRLYTEILDNTMDTFSSVISNNMNAVVKRMTGVSIILMVPTLIASFYGMNVDISLSTNPHAFWIIVGVSALLTSGAYLIFRHIKWV